MEFLSSFLPSRISMIRGSPTVTFISATPAKWKVLSVICVPGSPMDSAEMRPTHSPAQTWACSYSLRTASNIFFILVWLQFFGRCSLMSSMIFFGNLSWYSFARFSMVHLAYGFDDPFHIDLPVL